MSIERHDPELLSSSSLIEFNSWQMDQWKLILHTRDSPIMS